MSTAEVLEIQGTQVIKLPEGVRFDGERAAVRKVGNTLVLEPVKSDHWPENFFERIRIDDPAFVRPEQGPVPPAPALG